MEKISFDKGQDSAYKVLSFLQKEDPKTKNCHFISHGIGWGLYKKNPQDWRRILNESRANCGYGEQMGIVERYTQSLPKGKLEKKDIADLCGPQAQPACNHAMGHILLVEAKNDLDQAFTLCNGLKTKEYQATCFQGAVMERFVGDNLREHGIIPVSTSNWPSRLPEHEKLCGSLTGELLLACWTEITHPAYYYFNKDPQKVLSFCGKAPSTEAIRRCMTHVLPTIAGDQQYEIASLISNCEIAGKILPSFERSCFLIFATAKLNQTDFKDTSDVIPYCTSIPQDYRASCFSSVAGTLKRNGITDAQVEQFCMSIPAEYQSGCLDVLNQSIQPLKPAETQD